ncbi:MAG TPA: ATP-binding cassette domain-containing protein [Propionibacteriaceae bacterium]|nr:ATP-binding cassette domain-containing protein [Propionibacteriaceae bacterium]
MPASKIGRERSDHQPQRRAAFVCSSVGFAWPDGQVVFDDLDLTFPDGFTGLIGRNGGGKSTLLRILTGELPPTSGSVLRPALVGYLPQQLTLEVDRPVAELLGVADRLAALDRTDAGQARPADLDLLDGHWDLPERITAALAELGLADLDLHARIGTLSGGQAVLSALAGLFLARPDALVLDEPTNNPDRRARGLLAAAVRRWAGPVVVVSHDRELLDRVDQVVEIRAGSARVHSGNLTSFLAALAVEQEAAERSVRGARQDLRRQQRELVEARVRLDRRQRYARSQADNVPTIVAGAKKRAAQVSAGRLRGGHEADVVEAEQTLRAAEDRVRDDEVITVDLTGTTVPAGRDVLILEDVVLRNGRTVSLHLRGPERVAVTGANGSGKTTLIDTVIGILAPSSGTVRALVPVRVLPQRLDLLPDAEPVLTAVARFAPTADDNALRARLAGFLLGSDAVRRPVGTLSGGERFRATLAALLLAEPPPQLLVMDEPTNSLDLDSVAQLVTALRQYRGALLLASHDEPFLAEIGIDRRLELGA